MGEHIWEAEDIAVCDATADKCKCAATCIGASAETLLTRMKEVKIGRKQVRLGMVAPYVMGRRCEPI
jgi:hypothetical protein